MTDTTAPAFNPEELRFLAPFARAVVLGSDQTDQIIANVETAAGLEDRPEYVQNTVNAYNGELERYTDFAVRAICASDDTHQRIAELGEITGDNVAEMRTILASNTDWQALGISAKQAVDVVKEHAPEQRSDAENGATPVDSLELQAKETLGELSPTLIKALDEASLKSCDGLKIR